MERWSEGSGLALRRYDGVTVEQRAVLLKRCAHFSIGKPGTKAVSVLRFVRAWGFSSHLAVLWSTGRALPAFFMCYLENSMILTCMRLARVLAPSMTQPADWTALEVGAGTVEEKILELHADKQRMVRGAPRLKRVGCRARRWRCEQFSHFCVRNVLASCRGDLPRGGIDAAGSRLYTELDRSLKTVLSTLKLF